MVNLFRVAPACPDEQDVHGAACPDWWSRSPYPGAVEDWIAFVQGRGIERVCCLLADRTDRFDRLIERYAAAFGEEDVRHVPIPDRRLPDPEVVRARILPFLADSGRPVVVHCYAGVGRTGVVLAAWLVSRGFDPERAVELVSENGRRPLNAVDEGNATRAELLRFLEECAG